MTLQDYKILLYSMSYLLFLALQWLSREMKGLRLVNHNGLVSNPFMLIMLHLGGIVLFGILPYVSGHSSIILINYPSPGSLAVWTTLQWMTVLIIVSPMMAKTKFREVVRSAAPMNTTYSIEFIIAYFFVRIVFIAAYECWFRGYLLNDAIASFGMPLAVLLNVSLYTLLHVVNGKAEMFACLPFGLLLCVLCIWQGAVWPAMVIHLALTIPYEIRFVQKIKHYKRAAI